MSVWILPILGRMVIYRLIGMNRLCVVLIVSVFALNAAAQETVKLTSVGLSVDVDSSWELTQDVTTEIGGQVAGMGYFLRADSTRLDMFLVLRGNSLDTSDKESWGKQHKINASSPFELVDHHFDLPVKLPFDEVISSVRHENRGNEYGENGRSRYYVITGVFGEHTYHIKLGGLEKTFDEKTPEYLSILSSLQIHEVN